MNQEKLSNYFTMGNLIKFGIVSFAMYIINVIIFIIIDGFYMQGLFAINKFSPLALPMLIYNLYLGESLGFYLWFTLRNLLYIFQSPIPIFSLILFLAGLSINFLIATRLTVLDSIVGSITSSATQSTSKNKGIQKTDREYQPMSISDWLVTYLIMLIPLVNLIMIFVWGFGSNTQPSKANWAKASLIWFSILIIVYVLFLGIIIGLSM